MNLNRHYLLPLLIAMLLIPAQDLSAKKKKQVKEPTDRELWAGVLYRMAEPVLSNMSEGKLQQNMLVELSPTWDGRNKKVTYMECFGRLMAGLAPWISLPDDDTVEGAQRKQLARMGVKELCAGCKSGKSRLSVVEKRGADVGGCSLYCRKFHKRI